jgi:peptidoglycan/LPS O-acetylase OafA/YrhL
MGLVRLFLAWVVVADHWQLTALGPRSITIPDYFEFGFNSGYAVMFFYIVSGFLITYTLSRNYTADPGGAARFYRNRFIRIFSLYWPVLALTLVVFDGAWERLAAASPWDKLTGIFLLGTDWRISFADYPTPYFQAMVAHLHQAWTLGAELTFYLAAPLLMRSWKIGAALLAISLATRWALTGSADIWTYYFAGSTACFFMLGHLICLASQRWEVLARPWLGAALVVSSFAIMAFGSYAGGFDSPRLWASAICFTVALPGLFEASKNTRWMNLAGDLSYPIYLVHLGVMFVFSQRFIGEVLLPSTWPPVVAGYFSIAVVVAITTAVATVVHWAIEMPVAHAMHWLSGRRKRLAQHAV